MGNFRPIYLDHQATTPVDKRVLAAMLPYFRERPGNPASQSHLYGWEADAAVTQAREQLATAIGAVPEELIFTSGATEANNLAIKGVAEAHLHKGRHIITVQTEHSAVLEPCRYLETLGFTVTYLPVQANGQIQIAELATALRPDTVLVSVMAANNETGILQPLVEIGRLCRQHQVLFHTDAAQALGKIPLDMSELPVDLLSMTAHKIYGPKGIGALYVRWPQASRRTAVRLIAPQLHGGGQEQGYRSGTLPTPQVVGFAQAVDLMLQDLEQEQQRLRVLRQQLWAPLSQVNGVLANEHPTAQLPGCLNISVEGVTGNALLTQLRSVMAVSSGSACASRQTSPSHVLLAMGRSRSQASASIRFGLGRSTTSQQVEQAVQHLKQTIYTLRQSGD